ncbi:hypothetical protein GCM10010112_82750 [Actinoplanes lobatus]|uniref:Uncharacterized protein n=1 Tax=Actinoplanes lobatus TaxID=113568 RepID=A0A7W7MJD6_9ACTN|nr:hypothetical protein [Actinoplanes lobatus]MBB4752537.1 hypothetical protein [Actinoplanes lobatus]GGN93930.1 hypothetical protein GCM10010112_82750 [Actinoplanes lobatus]GIE44836.1 hypothetical protein Alo02nite_77340 [Actinoplanes lobatus]
MPRTVLAVAEDAFRLLTCEPSPLTFDGRPVTALPDRDIPVGELRDLLRRRTTDTVLTDAVWRQLAAHARELGPAWVVAAVGIALPGLTRMAARLSAGRRRFADDIDSELVAGFLHALRTDDLEQPRVWLRWCWAAWRAGLKAGQADDLLELPAEMPVGSRTPHRPYGHPDLILGRAVIAGVLTPAQAELIASTRLDNVLVEQIAAASGQPGATVRMRRKRAERKLVAALERGDLAVPRLSPAPA